LVVVFGCSFFSTHHTVLVALCAGWISVQTFCEWWLVAEQSLGIDTFVRSTFPGAALLEHTAATFRYQVSPPAITTAALAALALRNVFRSSREPCSVCHT
jgi:hypothetical protein